MNLWQSIVYFVSFGRKNIFAEWKIHLRTAFSLSVTFFLIFSLLCLFLNLRASLRSMKKSHTVVAYLKTSGADSEAQSLKKKFCQEKNVQSCNLQSQSDNQKSFIKKFPHFGPVLSTLEKSPFSDELHLELDLNDEAGSRIEDLIFDLEQESIVDEVSGGAAEAGRWTRLIQLLDLFLLVFICISFASVMAIIFNVVGILVYGRREEIEILSLVGATDFMLGIPFFVSSLLIGTLGFALAYLALELMLRLFNGYVLSWAGLGFIHISGLNPLWMLLFLMITLFLAFVSTLASVRQFIK